LRWIYSVFLPKVIKLTPRLADKERAVSQRALSPEQNNQQDD
jgi:hypothetical protein